jgi:hypothetical protein
VAAFPLKLLSVESKALVPHVRSLAKPAVDFVGCSLGREELRSSILERAALSTNRVRGSMFHCGTGRQDGTIVGN